MLWLEGIHKDHHFHSLPCTGPPKIQILFLRVTPCSRARLKTTKQNPQYWTACNWGGKEGVVGTSVNIFISTSSVRIENSQSFHHWSITRGPVWRTAVSRIWPCVRSAGGLQIPLLCSAPNGVSRTRGAAAAGRAQQWGRAEEHPCCSVLSSGIYEYLHTFFFPPSITKTQLRLFQWKLLIEIIK